MIKKFNQERFNPPVVNKNKLALDAGLQQFWEF